MAPPKAKSPKETAQYYRDNPEARKKKDAYNKDGKLVLEDPSTNRARNRGKK